MSGRIVNVRRERMPTKVLYNLDTMLSPKTDPKQNVVLGP